MLRLTWPRRGALAGLKSVRSIKCEVGFDIPEATSEK
jgi:hypothetical protein